MKTIKAQPSAEALKNDIKEAEALLNLADKPNYTIINHSLLSNIPYLTGNETKILLYLLSRSPTFKPTYSGLAKIFKISKSTLSITINGLKKKGYLSIKHYSNNNVEWIITQTPFTNAQNIAPKGDLESITRQYKNGVFSKEQYIARLKNYIANIKYEWRNDLTDEEIQEIIKINWLK